MTRRALAAGSMAIAALTAAGAPAFAHHAMDGQLPTTFSQGLLSGLGHPVIGADHLAFIIALGIAAALVASRAALIGAFLAASTAGVLVHLSSIDVPGSEALVASSVIVAGALIALSRNTGPALWIVLAGLAGLFHGYAFGESIVGAERNVVGAYLIGIAIVSATIAAAVSLVAGRLISAGDACVLQRRVAGGAIGAVGAGFLLLNLVGN